MCKFTKIKQYSVIGFGILSILGWVWVLGQLADIRNQMAESEIKRAGDNDLIIHSFAKMMKQSADRNQEFTSQILNLANSASDLADAGTKLIKK